MPLSTSVVNRLQLALASESAGNETVTAINKGSAMADQSTWCLTKLIVATSTSQTTDFASLKVGDKIVHIPATAGNSDFFTCATAGDLGAAAVVGDLYQVWRAFAAPAASAQTF